MMAMVFASGEIWGSDIPTSLTRSFTSNFFCEKAAVDRNKNMRRILTYCIALA
jgi:hypothetical protein